MVGGFFDALLSGRKGAVTELLVNNYYICLSNFYDKMINSSSSTKKVNETKTTTTTKKPSEGTTTKAEIVEFKKFKDDVNATLNVNFSTVTENEDNGMLEGDELLNIIDTIVTKTVAKSELNLDEQEKHIKYIALCVLLADGKTTFSNVFKSAKELGLDNRDGQVEINTIFKWITNTKLIPKESTVQLNEYVTAQLLFDTISVIVDIDDWGLEANMAEILNKARRRLDEELVSNGVIAGDVDIDPVSPISFNQGILNTAFSPKEPKMKKTVEEYIKNHIMSILDPNWVHDNQVELKITHLIDDVDPNKDTGMAKLEVSVHGLASTNALELDLDSTSGNGFCLAVYSVMNGYGNFQKVFVNIEKFPNIIKKVVMSNGNYILNNPNDNNSIVEFDEVMKDSFHPLIYTHYDLSGMSKHLDLMRNKDKMIFANNLMSIMYANWQDMGPGEHMYRMRIRKYETPDKFTLVSDYKTRQQYTDFIPVIGNNYKKYFKEEQASDPSILVCKFDNGNLSIARDGKALTNIFIPSNILEIYRKYNEGETPDTKVQGPVNFEKYNNANPVLDTNGNIKQEYAVDQPVVTYPNIEYQQNPIFNPTTIQINGDEIVR